jgi:type II secretory pathway component GspD/PulD (secretin)
MNANIDIKTPAGQSLEGFPIVNTNIEGDRLSNIVSEIEYMQVGINCNINPQLHKGDKITIEIL